MQIHASISLPSYLLILYFPSMNFRFRLAMLKIDIQKNDKRASGIKNLQDGSSIIPSSVRPDGSIRSERKVRPGYVPPEDISVYRTVHHNESSQKMSRNGVETHGYRCPGAMASSNLSKSAKKRAKRKENFQNSKNSTESSESKTKDSHSVIDDIEKRMRNFKIKESQKSETSSKNENESRQLNQKEKNDE
ncbi:hypothetical protein T552_01130 [Pneumocystis carinii B80]|uniref:WIBG Mago-binding domain-containing protein n=1 Tax=Pneumocystis carinii (strain B80) TaxID=1408658 RepID=A0A0W4ZLB7_PNEC8|nr:hypothetical protein T552_01130 [Pneumocystis carinii B80]KTW29173.1 hypothetical protein T552_01130 [Pneumocystis carinii B80]